MQLAAQRLRPAEEDTRFGRRVDLADRLEDAVPIGAAEARGCAQAGYGILFGIVAVDDNVRCVVVLDASGEILVLLLAIS